MCCLHAHAEVRLGVGECHDHCHMPVPAMEEAGIATTWALWLQQGSSIVPWPLAPVHLSKAAGGCSLQAYLPMPAEYVEKALTNTSISGERFHSSLPLQHMFFRLANESLSHTLQALCKLLFFFFLPLCLRVVRPHVGCLEGKPQILTALWTPAWLVPLARHFTGSSVWCRPQALGRTPAPRSSVRSTGLMRSLHVLWCMLVFRHSSCQDSVSNFPAILSVDL